MGTRIPFSTMALGAALGRLDDEWETYQTSRNRDGIYRYLSAVFDLIAIWEMEGSGRKNAARALRLRGRRKLTKMPNPFAVLILVTSGADHKTRSKWSRVMRYAAAYKPDSEPLEQFVKRKGGINSCVARFSQRLGEGLSTSRIAGLE